MKLFKMGKNVRIMMLICHMVGEVVKKWAGQGFIFQTIIPAHYTF